MPVKYTKRGSPHEYIAARLPGAFDPLPSWFPVLERAGKLRYEGENMDVEVRVITGQWWHVNVGDWVVVQRSGLGLPGQRNFGCYVIEDQDFRRMFDEARG